MSAKKSRRPRANPPGQPEPSPARGTASLPPWLLYAGLVLLTLAVYYPAWHGGMLWDDDAHITQVDLRSLSGLWRIWFDVGATQQYYPAAHSAFWLFYQLWADNTLGYHLVNIVLHASSAFLVFVILRRLAIPGAVLAALIFAVHPVNVESVAWMTELKNTLSGVCYLGAALMYLRFDQRRDRLSYAIAAGLFVLALFSKTVTATLPAALLVVFWWQRGRLRWREDVVPLVPFFAVGAAGGLLTAWVERAQIGAEGPAFQFTFIERCLIAGRAFWFYLGKLVWPADLIFIYPRWQISQQAAWQYAYPLALVALVAALWWYRTRSRAPLAAVLFFAGTLFPALGFFNVYPFIYSFVADHFQYLASLGIIVLFSAAVAALEARWRAAASVAVVVPLALIATSQSRQYVDAETLYRSTLSANPSCWMAYVNIGKLRQEEARAQGDDPRLLEEAASNFREALRLEPNVWQAHNNLGTILLSLGKFDEAQAEFQEALRQHPGDPGVQYNVGLGLQKMGRSEDALAPLTAVLAVKPNHQGAHVTMGDALLSLGRIEEAIAQYNEALRLAPRDAEAHNNLGSALARSGRMDEAVAQYLAALEINPRSARASTNLGLALLRAGRVDEALKHLRDAVTFDPNFMAAHYNLANALDQAGRPEEAIAEFAAAVKLEPGVAGLHNDFGIALAELRRFPEAIAEFREALRLKPDYDEAKANLARALRER
ncbi:MAG TPA: tetratricopeptide repeat protein [Vicinamibacterales bacterium]|nr:tetratricopeptide repeat protein [Vicinamibacterales bacterium]